MIIPQVAAQQRSGPDGRVIPERPGVAIDHRGDQSVDEAATDARAARPRGIAEPGPRPRAVSLLEPAYPVVDGLTADVEHVGDLLDAGPLGEPEQGLGATSLLGPRGMA